MKSKVVMQMVGQDGNAFAILGRFTAAARKAGWTPDEIKEVTNEATKGDYSHLLCTIMDNVEEPESEDDEDDEHYNPNLPECDDCGEEWEKYDICKNCDCCPDCCDCDEDEEEG